MYFVNYMTRKKWGTLCSIWPGQRLLHISIVWVVLPERGELGLGLGVCTIVGGRTMCCGRRWTTALFVGRGGRKPNPSGQFPCRYLILSPHTIPHSTCYLGFASHRLVLTLASFLIPVHTWRTSTWRLFKWSTNEFVLVRKSAKFPYVKDMAHVKLVYVTTYWCIAMDQI